MSATASETNRQHKNLVALIRASIACFGIV